MALDGASPLVGEGAQVLVVVDVTDHAPAMAAPLWCQQAVAGGGRAARLSEDEMDVNKKAGITWCR